MKGTAEGTDLRKRQEMDEGKEQKKTKAGRPARWVLAGGAFAGTALGLLWLADVKSGFAQWYTLHVYTKLSGAAGVLFGQIPFSVSEFLLYSAAVVLIFCFVRLVCRCAVCRGKKAAGLLAAFGARVFCGLCALFLVYALTCGINYHRTSFAEETGISLEGGTEQELERVCRILTEEVNERAGKVQRNQQGVMTLTCHVPSEAVKAMEGLGENYACLSGSYPQPKGLMFSWILSVQKLTGIYSPFTIEANYNTDMTDYNIPFTACHELAHLRGFMQEEEANFIGFLAGVCSENSDFQYSSYLMGWIYCTNALYETDEDIYRQIRQELSGEVSADLEANSRFWEQYDSPVAEVADQVNDSYLKANGQEDGVASYDRIVELILSYYRRQD